jgi:hypothetical protein
VLQHAAELITSDDLYAVAHVNDTYRKEAREKTVSRQRPLHHRKPDEDWLESWEYEWYEETVVVYETVTVSRSDLRELARQELIRRGLEIPERNNSEN